MRIVYYIVALTQLWLAIRFFKRVWSTLDGTRIEKPAHAPVRGSVSVILPVLNEVSRVGHALECLKVQGDVVGEILVVDGGSTDGTPSLIRKFTEQDPRIRLVFAHPVPEGWNGKAHGLQVGLGQVSPTAKWVVTIDADVAVSPDGVARAVAFAESSDIPFLSVATSQIARTAGLSIVHPSLLSTLVYRFGIPGHVARTLDEVQANGQFAFYERVPLQRAGGFQIARDSICEDITLARHLFLSGYQVGFYEGDNIAETEMYADGLECLRNWPRSLSLDDRFDSRSGVIRLLNMLFLQVIPVLSMFWLPEGWRSNRPFMVMNRTLAGARIGLLFGMRRAYSEAAWTYWFSPVFDPFAFLACLISMSRKRHVWRGRQLVTRES